MSANILNVTEYNAILIQVRSHELQIEVTGFYFCILKNLDSIRASVISHMKQKLLTT